MMIPVYAITARKKIVNHRRRTYRWGKEKETVLYLQPHRPYKRIFEDKNKAQQKRMWSERVYSSSQYPPHYDMDTAYDELIDTLKNLGIL